MSTSSVTANSFAKPAYLTTWKEIAQHMGKGVRTVQRWEQNSSLPVHRLLKGSSKSSVIANSSELDAWVQSFPTNQVKTITASSDQQIKELERTIAELRSEISALRAQLEKAPATETPVEKIRTE